MAWRESVAALPDWLLPWAVGLFLVSLAVTAGIVFERIIIVAVKRLASRTSTRVDDLVVHALHPAIGILVVLYTIHFGLHWLGHHLPAGLTTTWDRLALALAVLVAAVVVARLLGALLRHWTTPRVEWQSVGRLATRIGNVVVYIVAFLVVLGSYGISITPIITSLGIAGLAVALALQDTLANFFAGVWIQTGRSLQPGHYVRLESEKLEGYVEEVGWRTTKIRQLANNIIVVPNSKFAQAIVIDYHMPGPRMSLLVPISVGYECDPRQVERILVEEAQKAAGEVDGLLADPPPFVRFIPGFGDYALQFTLICQVREFVDQYLAQHELRFRILDRFRKEGIRIPYPIRESFIVPPSRADVQPAVPVGR